MKKKFLQFLSEKIKDLGLSDKAVSELVEAGSAGLADDASDDDIKAKVDSVVPFAKAMQGEYTRKVQAVKQSQKQSPEGDGGGEGSGDDKNIPAWFKDWEKQKNDENEALKAEIAELKAAKSKEEREAQIAAKAKELGIPDFLMKRFSIAEDADFVKELTDYKQDLVTAKLMPAESAGEQSTSEQAMKDAAKAWAETLPNA